MVTVNEHPTKLIDLIAALQLMLQVHGNIPCFTMHPDWGYTTIEGKVMTVAPEDVQRLGNKVLVL